MNPNLIFAFFFFCTLSSTWSSAIPELNKQVIGVESISSKATTITVPNGGAFGEWQFLETCPGNSTAVGFQLKVERSSAVDATGLNAIRLYCLDLTVDPPAFAGSITSFEQMYHQFILFMLIDIQF